MKKIMMIAALVLGASSLFGQNGVIKELAGTVELKRAGQGAFVPAKAGDQVAKDTVVSTGFKSSALITVGSSIITVRPLTRLSLAEISAQAGTETIDIKLQAGRVRVDVNPPAGTRASFAVQSPSATASVRGTAFDFDTRNLVVSEGTVAFNGTAGAVMLIPAGSESRVSSENGKAADPVMVSEAALTPPVPVGTDSAPARDELPPLPKGTLTIGLDFQFEQAH